MKSALSTTTDTTTMLTRIVPSITIKLQMGCSGGTLRVGHWDFAHSIHATAASCEAADHGNVCNFKCADKASKWGEAVCSNGTWVIRENSCGAFPHFRDSTWCQGFWFVLTYPNPLTLNPIK